jgi:hypothetical protein
MCVKAILPEAGVPSRRSRGLPRPKPASWAPVRPGTRGREINPDPLKGERETGGLFVKVFLNRNLREQIVPTRTPIRQLSPDCLFHEQFYGKKHMPIFFIY